VDYYNPTLDTWTPVAKMSVCRPGVGVEVLNDLYMLLVALVESTLKCSGL